MPHTHLFTHRQWRPISIEGGSNQRQIQYRLFRKDAKWIGSSPNVTPPPKQKTGNWKINTVDFQRFANASVHICFVCCCLRAHITAISCSVLRWLILVSSVLCHPVCWGRCVACASASVAIASASFLTGPQWITMNHNGLFGVALPYKVPQRPLLLVARAYHFHLQCLMQILHHLSGLRKIKATNKITVPSHAP